MRLAKRTTGSRRGPSRRLSSHVLSPLVTLGIVAVAGGSAAVTLSERNAAIHSVDARAAAIRDISEASLKRTGRLATARAGDVRLRLSSEDRPLPGGRSVVGAGGSRVYTFTVAARGARHRLRFSLPSASVGRSTIEALVISAGAGLLILLLLVTTVALRLRRGA